MMARRLACTTLTLATVLFTAFAALGLAAEAAERRIIIFEDADFFGFDYETLRGRTLEQCEAACLSDSNCVAFTYNSSARWCFLKSDIAELRDSPGAIAGQVTEYEAGVVETPARPDFIPRELETEAQELATELAVGEVDPSQGQQALIESGSAALREGDPRAAAAAFQLALRVNTASFDAWGGLTLALLRIEGEDYSERSQLAWQGTAAAYNAYLNAGNTRNEAHAFHILARALVRRFMFRPALESYKESLLRAESARARSEYEDLHAEHGFRILDHTVESESSSPRICVQFSEELQQGTQDFADFVTINQETAGSVSVDGYQLCIDGLAHGERYQIGLRSGIPSTVGEDLTSPVSLAIYVPDRQPSVRFTGRNYVLPRVGAHGIPVISVNTDSVDIRLYAIGERALSGAITQDQIFSQLNGYSASEIENNSGTFLWEGTLDVASEQNEEVTTSFPVDEALGNREPGIYVLVAQPTAGRTQQWDAQATQWFVVSDIGLSTLMGEDGLHVFARALSDAGAMEDVNVTLVARNNTILGTARSDETGHAHFAAGLTRGTGGEAPALLTAEMGATDFAFLDLSKPGFDLTDRGVTGRAAPGPLDVFIYSERGVYRPGAVVHLTALVRDAEANAVPATPLTFVFTRPDGVEHGREIAQDQGLGGYGVDLPLQGGAMRGTWRAEIYADPDGRSIAELQFLVEDFVPDRIEFDMETTASSFATDETTVFDLDGRYLYGAVAAGLRLEGEIAVRPVNSLPEFPNYRFGLADEQVLPVRLPISGLPATDENGQARVEVDLETVPNTTRPLEAELIVRMREGGGRAVERSTTLPVALTGPQIGIRPLFNDLRVGEGETAQFDVIAISPQLAETALGEATWELVRIEQNFQWYEVNGSWGYESVNYATRVASGQIALDGDGPVEVSAPVDWGHYRLEVTSTSAGGPVSSVDFYAGWYVDLASADTPDILQIALDRSSYAVGDTATVTIEPRFAGTAMVMVMNEQLLATYTVDVGMDGASVDIPVADTWGSGAYVTAVLFRPTSEAHARMPGRAIGLQWLAVDTAERTLDISLETPDLIRPGDTLDIPVSVAGAAPGERVFVTVAAVDVGILNLTGYTPPSPDDWYFAQRRLGVEMRDLYGQLIDGMQGVTGRVRSGGGEAGLGLTGTPPAQDPVSLYSGIVELDDEGRASVPFDVPDFTGTLRVMAVAWTQTGVGHGTTDVVVRDEVVLMVSGPRFLAPGDLAQFRIEVDNLEGPAGDYVSSISHSDELDVGASGETMTLALGERHETSVTVAALTPGVGQLTVRLRHEAGIDVSRTYRIGVRPSQPSVSERQIVTLEPDATLTVSAERLAGFLEETGSVTVSISRAGAIDVPSLLQALDRYPYGCSEQITSRALPLLYLADVAAQSGLGREEDLRVRVQNAIADVLAHQSSAGSFGLWGPGSGDLWLNAYVTDFLTRARELAYDVPDRTLSQALDNLQNRLGYAPEVDGDGHDIAYALYVLARNRRATLGDLRYYADTQLDAFGSAMAKAHIAAALALYGERERSTDAFTAAYNHLEDGENGLQAAYGYATTLRDGAATLALAAESTPAPSLINDLSRLVAELRGERAYTSTQENAWLLLAAAGLLADQSDIELEVAGETHSGNLLQSYGTEELDDEPITIVNRGDAPIDVVMTATGIPGTSAPAGGKGFSITRAYYTLDGKPVGVGEVGQNERFVVVLTVEEHHAWRSRLLVADLLPAGFEIDNPNLVYGGDTEAFTWLPDTPATANLEFRDDRFVAALDRADYDDRSFTLAYVVRAVTPGVYVAPPALVENMYRPYLNARTETGRIEVIGPRP
jgi:hypothetical protein